MATVHHHVLASNVTCIPRTQEDAQARDLFRTAKAVHRNTFEEISQELLIRQPGILGAALEERFVILTRIDEAGRYRVNRNAVRSQFIGEAATQTQPGRTDRRVGTFAAPEPIVTMRPQRLAFMPGTTARAKCAKPLTTLS
jgi:hypothetical protein